MENEEFLLPRKITDKYAVLTCMKRNDKRRVYLLKRKEDGIKAVLKCGVGSNGDLLFQEYWVADAMSDRCGILLKSIDYFFEGHTHYYIHEYAEGKTVAQLFAEKGAFSEAESRRIVAAICEGISVLHSQQPPIICRDINPDNVLLCDDGKIKLVDIDSARYYDKTASSDTLCIGTKEMAAPEQFGYVQTNEKTDIYVLGMLLLYLCTGAYDRHAKLPLSIKKIVKKSTAFDPEDRYSDAMQMRRALVGESKKYVFVAATVAIVLTLLCVSAFMLNKTLPVADEQVSDYAEIHAEFVSSKIENAVRLQLGKTADEPVYLSELSEVQTLILCGDLAFSTWEELTYYHQQCIDSYAALPKPTEPLALDDLEMLSGLKYLCLDKQALTEIPQLPSQLEKISLMDNELIELSGIEKYTNLRELELSGNYGLADISALSTLSELNRLNLSCCVSLNSVDDIVELPLNTLHINYTDVKHIEELSRFTKLKEFLFSDLDSVTLSQISELKQLEFVEICGDCEALEGLSVFTGLNELYCLTIGDCSNFSDLGGVSELEKLSFFSVINCSVIQLPDEIADTHITTIDLRGCGIQNFTPLAEIEGLQVIYADEERTEELYRLFEGRDISIFS